MARSRAPATAASLSASSAAVACDLQKTRSATTTVLTSSHAQEFTSKVSMLVLVSVWCVRSGYCTAHTCLTSSRISSFGFRTSALASAIRCRWPPDSSLQASPTYVSKSYLFQQPSTSQTQIVVTCPQKLISCKQSRKQSQLKSRFLLCRYITRGSMAHDVAAANHISRRSMRSESGNSDIKAGPMLQAGQDHVTSTALRRRTCQ